MGKHRELVPDRGPWRQTTGPGRPGHASEYVTCPPRPAPATRLSKRPAPPPAGPAPYWLREQCPRPMSTLAPPYPVSRRPHGPASHTPQALEEVGVTLEAETTAR